MHHRVAVACSLCSRKCRLATAWPADRPWRQVNTAARGCRNDYYAQARIAQVLLVLRPSIHSQQGMEVVLGLWPRPEDSRLGLGDPSGEFRLGAENQPVSVRTPDPWAPTAAAPRHRFRRVRPALRGRAHPHADAGSPRARVNSTGASSSFGFKRGLFRPLSEAVPLSR